MRKILVLIGLLLAPGILTQAQTQPRQPTDLNQIVAQIERVAMATNGDIAKLRVDKWKTDSQQRQQLQKVADSLQRNITDAVPGLIADVQNTHGSVSSSFKLYHNLNVVYEFLSSLADAAGAVGKKEEYEPLAQDAAALDAVRSSLSGYIEQTATSYESRMQNAARSAQQTPPPVKVIVDDEPAKKPKPKKKRSSTSSGKPAAKASPSPSPSPSAPK
jgi:hypothetical protein